MSNVKKIKKLVVLGSTMLTSLVCAGLLLNIKPVQANADGEEVASFANIQGASVRYTKANEEGDRNGLRFTYTMEDIDLTTVKEAGMLLIPTQLLGDATLTPSTAKVSNTKFIENGTEVQPLNKGTWNDATGQFVVDENGTDYGMFVYVYNLPSTAFDLDFTCVGYYQLKDQATVTYTNTEVRSMAYVANATINGGVSEDKAEILTSYLPVYDNVVFEAGAGVIENAQTATKYGTPIDATVTAPEGYTFEGWFNAAGEAATTITGNTTVYARYAKDGGTVVASVQNGLAIPYAGDSIVSASLNGETVAATVADGNINLAGSLFEGNQTYTLVVQETANQKTTYTVSAVDANQDRLFAPIDTAYAKAVQYGTAVSSALSIATDPHGKTGKYFRVESAHEQPGLKVMPQISEAELSMYADGEVRFEYYVENTNAALAQILARRRTSTPDDIDSANTEYYQMDSVEKGTWKTVKIPVSEFLKVVDDVQSTTGEEKNLVTTSVYNRIVEGFTNNQHNGKLFALSYTDNISTAVFYVGNMQVVSAATLAAEKVEALKQPLAWQEKTTSSDDTRVYNYGNKDEGFSITEASAMPIDDTLIAGLGSEWYYTAKSTGAAPGIKVTTNLEKEQLEERQDQFLVFAYYYDCLGKNNKVKHISLGTNSYYGSTENAFNAWQLISVPVSTIYDVYSDYTSISNNRLGLLLESSDTGDCTSTLYVSEMTIMTEEDKNAVVAAHEQAVKDAEAAALLKPIAWQAKTTTGVTGHKYDGTQVGASIVEAADMTLDMTKKNIPSEWYYNWAMNSSSETDIKINTCLSKEQLEARADQYLVFDYYLAHSAPTNSATTTVMVANSVAYTTQMGAVNSWQLVVVPVSYLITNYASFANMGSNWTNSIVKIAWNNPADISIYVSEMKIMSKDDMMNTIPDTISWQSVTDHKDVATGYSAGNKTGLTVVDGASAPEGAVAGDKYYMYTTTSSKSWNDGIKVVTCLSKEILELYTGGYIEFSYYINYENANASKAVHYGYYNNNDKLGDAAFAYGTWETGRISVDGLLAQYSAFTNVNNTSQIRTGLILQTAWAADVTTTFTIYLSELKVHAAK